MQQLLEARRSGVQVEPPFALPDRAAVYAIQDGVAAATGPVAGWKVGARTPTAEPNPAPLLAGALVKSPARFDGKAMHMIGVEIEISFHIVRDIAARSEPVGREEALAAVGDAFVGMEVVDTRLADFKSGRSRMAAGRQPDEPRAGDRRVDQGLEEPRLGRTCR